LRLLDNDDVGAPFARSKRSETTRDTIADDEHIDYFSSRLIYVA